MHDVKAKRHSQSLERIGCELNNQLFPIKVRTTVPSPFAKSADMVEVAIGEDGMDYAVKTGQTAASEMLCYKIFSACGIAVPYSAILLMPDGSHAFGSRIERGLSNQPTTNPAERNEWLNECGSLISAICALDFLIANEDRHLGNFLFFNGVSGGKVCMAMDFSRALLYAPWPLPATWAIPNNTSSTVMGMRSLSFWNSATATQALLSAPAIQQNTWSSWVNTLPAGWIKPDIKDTLSAWWGTSDFQMRVQDCMGAVK